MARKMTKIDLKNDPNSRLLFHFSFRFVEHFHTPNLGKLDPKQLPNPMSIYDFIKQNIANFNVKTQHNALRCLAGNIAAFHRVYFDKFEVMPPAGLVIAIPLGADSYPSKDTAKYYGIPFFSRQSMVDLLNECYKAGLLIQLNKGYKNPGYKTGFQTVIEPAGKLLLHLPPVGLYAGFDELKPVRLVELRNTKKLLVKPAKKLMPAISKLEANVAAINSSYAGHRFEALTSNYFSTVSGVKKYNYNSLSPYGVSSPNTPIKIDIYNDLALKRIFNKNSLKSGGRFTCQFHNMPKADRKNIFINNQPTIELDYSCHHSRILYHTRLEQDYPGDIYNVGLTSQHATAQGIRNLVKLAFLIIYNCDNWQSFYKAYKNELDSNNPPVTLPADISAKEIVAAIKNTHPGLCRHFCKDKSYELMNLDSQIAEDVLLEFVKLGKPCLGIHDSFIVKQEDEQLLRQVMTTSYQKILKTSFQPRIT